MVLLYTLEEKVQKRTFELEQSQINLKEANIKLERLSNIDTLTNIPNRRSLNCVFESAWNSAEQSGKLLTVLMIDIDCFKLFNDTYGHQLGDNILVMVAQTLQKETEINNGYIARYGGEEFFVLFEGKSYEQIKTIAKTLNEQIFQLKIEHMTSTVTKWITVSIGMAQLNYSINMNKDELVKRADQALYKCKDRGRNAVFYNDGLDIRKVDFF